MVEGEGFEPPKAEPADLQSAPVDRLGTPPPTKIIVRESLAYCQHFEGSSLALVRVKRPSYCSCNIENAHWQTTLSFLIR